MAKLRQRPRAQSKGRPPEMNGLAMSQSARDKIYCLHALSDARAAEDCQAKSLANAIENAARKRSRQRLASLSLECASTAPPASTALPSRPLGSPGRG